MTRYGIYVALLIETRASWDRDLRVDSWDTTGSFRTSRWRGEGLIRLNRCCTCVRGVPELGIQGDNGKREREREFLFSELEKICRSKIRVRLEVRHPRRERAEKSISVPDIMRTSRYASIVSKGLVEISPFFHESGRINLNNRKTVSVQFPYRASSPLFTRTYSLTLDVHALFLRVHSKRDRVSEADAS